jgi:hypothetical protein
MEKRMLRPRCEAGTEAPRLRNLLILSRYMNISIADLICRLDQ